MSDGVGKGLTGWMVGWVGYALTHKINLKQALHGTNHDIVRKQDIFVQDSHMIPITGLTHAKLVSLTSLCCSGWPTPMNTPQGQQLELSSDGSADFNAWLESDLVLIINFNSHTNSIWTHIHGTWSILLVTFYPRPVLAFGYCRCLRVCVCACVCPSIISLSVQ